MENTKNNEIGVSICCLAFNHGKYIRRCLDGIVMQKTDFKFELLIHDDASTDDTADIIREYERKYPDIIKPIYQTVNQYSQGVWASGHYLFSRIQGKYVAWCEGDDYWTDPTKLQQQFDALEGHPDCHMCVHKVQEVTETEKDMGIFHPKCSIPSGVLSSGKFLEIALDGWSFQTSSYFVRAEDLAALCAESPEFFSRCPVGDVPLVLYFAQLGSVYYIREQMSCYRKGAAASWSNRMVNAPQLYLEHLDIMSRIYKSYETYTNHRFDECVEMKVYGISCEKDYAYYLQNMQAGNYKAAYRVLRDSSLTLPFADRTRTFLRAYAPPLFAAISAAKRGLSSLKNRSVAL